MKKILVLGASGMLGSMVFHYLRNQADCEVHGTVRQDFLKQIVNKDISKRLVPFDVLNDDVDADIITVIQPDLVINCIGLIKQLISAHNNDSITKAIRINSLLPRRLQEVCSKNDILVVQIATDCVFSGHKGKYAETDAHDALDVYGKTKSLGEVEADNFMNIRCSIVGPEIKGRVSLLEWFLSRSSSDRLKGYEHHLWNGVTTLQFAKLCHELIKLDFNVIRQAIRDNGIFHFTPNNTVSKYELLNLMNRIYDRNLIIEKFKGEENVDRTLVAINNFANNLIAPTSIDAALSELVSYTKENNFYNFY